MPSDNQDNVVKFPMLRKIMNAVQAPGRWADENGAADAREGMARLSADAVKRGNPNVSDEVAMNEAREMGDLASQGGMMAGTLYNAGSPMALAAKTASAGPGVAGVKQMQDMSRMAPAVVDDAGAAASKQIIDQETNYIRNMARQMAAKNKPKYTGGQ